MSGNTTLPDWRRAHGGPLLRATIRNHPEDFQVSENLDFEFTGDGEHDFLLLEKINANTNWVARGLARKAGVPIRDVGFAGMKDRIALTRQWFSVRRPSGAGTDWSTLDIPGVRVLATARNQRKLRRGAHCGNEFRIALRNVSGMDDRLDQLLRTCRDCGVPNYFGEQRFGRDNSNIALAQAFFRGKRLKRDDRSFALSAARALLFNHILQRRVENSTWNTLLPGELANLDGSGSVFSVASLDDTLRRRCAGLDIHASGALWGKGGSTCGDAVALLEQAVADEFPDISSGLERHAEPARRALRLAVRNFRWTIDGDALWLEFYLARGGFATAVLREIAAY